MNRVQFSLQYTKRSSYPLPMVDRILFNSLLSKSLGSQFIIVHLCFFMQLVCTVQSLQCPTPQNENSKL